MKLRAKMKISGMRNRIWFLSGKIGIRAVCDYMYGTWRWPDLETGRRRRIHAIPQGRATAAGHPSTRCARCQNVQARSVFKCLYGSVPRAVASVARTKARSLPLAVLIQRAFPYMQLQTDLNDSIL